MSDEKFDIPFTSPAVPNAFGAETKIRFSCHKGISCFNACCRRADVTLAPYDVLRLKKRLGMTSEEFLDKHTVPFQMDQDGVPGLKMKTTDEGACLLLDGENGCGVYADRPTVCRYYPVALLNVREKDSSEPAEKYSLIKEEHCKGHEEAREISVADYRKEQGCVEYDDMNREWYRLILKKKSAGPAVGKPSEMSLQVFFMASYNLDMFRRFVLSDSFKNTYKLSDAFYSEVGKSDEVLLDFAFRFLRQVLFAERSVEEVTGIWEQRLAERKEVWDLRTKMEVERRQKDLDDRYKGDD